MQINDLLNPKRIALGLTAYSKKRVLEKISALLHEGGSGLDQNAAFQSLIERERLGSTGVGNGVALPHGRLKRLKSPVGAFATLAREIDYDAVDGRPIRMVFALVVPEHANEEHLQILSKLASIFSDKEFCNALLRANNAEEVYRALSNDSSSVSRKVG